jgi:ABC-2 type transport system ATP-binding protein
MANGLIVADGSTTEIKARVGRRTIRATLPDVAVTDLATLPGVVLADRHGDTIQLSCTDSDAAIRALLAARPDARDIEIQGAALEDAFVELTTERPELVGVGS